MYDVIVIGGGTAGCFAAICAAKQGAKTLLVEKTSMLGGTMTAGRVNYPGLFFACGKQIIGGPCLTLLLKAGAPMPPANYPKYTHWLGQVHVNEFDFLCVLEEACEQNGVELLYHTIVSKVKEDTDCVQVYLTGKEGTFKVCGKILIDASGDANAVNLAGYPLDKRETRQPATLINDIGGYDINDIDENAFRFYVEKCMEQKLLLPEYAQGGNFYYQLQKGRLSMHIPCNQAETSKGKTQLERSARGILYKIIQVFRNFKGLEKLKVINFAVECGVRESVRIVGEMQMSVEDYLSGKRYEDAVCYCYYPVDEHLPTGIRKIYLEDELVPTIPYKALIPKNSKRILVAGRTVASDSDTNSAVRVQAPCMAMGQVAGVAAAIAAKFNLSIVDVPIGQLRQELTKIGAIVP